MSKKWFGLFEVKPQNADSDVLDGALGAYVNVVGLANSSTKFVKAVNDALLDYSLEIISSENIQNIDLKKSNSNDFDKEIINLLESLQDSNPVQFDEFQAYIDD